MKELEKLILKCEKCKPKECINYEIDWTPEQSKTNKQASQNYSNINYMQVLAQQGWQCPVCKRILAPFVSECPCGGQGMKTWITTSGTDNKTITNC